MRITRIESKGTFIAEWKIFHKCLYFMYLFHVVGLVLFHARCNYQLRRLHVKFYINSTSQRPAHLSIDKSLLLHLNKGCEVFQVVKNLIKTQAIALFIRNQLKCLNLECWRRSTCLISKERILICSPVFS